MRHTVCSNLLQNTKIQFIDIGARGGIPPHWEELKQSLAVTAFEPDPAEAKALADAGLNVVPAAAWSYEGEAPLYITRSPGASSLLEPASEVVSAYPQAERFEVIQTEKVPVIRLDNALRGDFDFIKIDVQGGEGHVLRGAEDILPGLVGIEVEISLLPLYRGGATFGEVSDLLARYGFDLVDMRPTYWRRTEAMEMAGCKGQLAFWDALFFKSPPAANWGAEKMRRALACCEVYGLRDYQQAYLAGGRHEELKCIVNSRGGWLSRLPEFRYRLLLAHLLKDAGDALLTSKQHWAVAEQALGNKPRHRLTRWLR